VSVLKKQIQTLEDQVKTAEQKAEREGLRASRLAELAEQRGQLVGIGEGGGLFFECPHARHTHSLRPRCLKVSSTLDGSFGTPSRRNTVSWKTKNRVQSM
jgi:hypothetical protein